MWKSGELREVVARALVPVAEVLVWGAVFLLSASTCDAGRLSSRLRRVDLEEEEFEDAMESFLCIEFKERIIKRTEIQ